MKNVLLLWALAVLFAGNDGYSFSLFPSKNKTETNATSVEITARVWNRTEAPKFMTEPTTEAATKPQDDPSRVYTNIVRHTLQRTPSDDLFAEINVDGPQPPIFAPNNPFSTGMDVNMPPPGMGLPMGPPVYPPFPWGTPSGFGYQPPPWAMMRNNYQPPFYPYAPAPAWMNPPPAHFLPYRPVYDMNMEVYGPPSWERYRRHLYSPVPSWQTPSYVRHHPVYFPMHYDQYPSVEVQPVSEEPVEPKPKRNRIHFMVPTTQPPIAEQDFPEVHNKPASHYIPQHSEYQKDHPIRHGYHNPFYRQHHYYY